jgi:hypothetical protein
MDRWKQDREEAKAAIRRDYFDKAKGLRGPALEQAKEELELKLHGVDAKYDGLARQITNTGAALAARTGRDDVKFKTQELMATEEQKLAADKQKREESLREKKSHEFERKQVIPSAAATVKPDTTVQELYSGKDIGVALSTEESKQVHAARGDTLAFIGAAKQLRDHLVKYGRDFDDDPAVQTQRQALGNVVIGKMSATMMNSGVLNGQDRPVYESTISTSVRRGGKEAAAGVESLIGLAESGYDAAARGRSRLAPGEKSVAAPHPQRDLKPGGFGLRAQPDAPAKPAAAPADERSQAAEWLQANPNAPASQVARIKAKYGL